MIIINCNCLPEFPNLIDKKAPYESCSYILKIFHSIFGTSNFSSYSTFVMPFKTCHSRDFYFCSIRQVSSTTFFIWDSTNLQYLQLIKLNCELWNCRRSLFWFKQLFTISDRFEAMTYVFFML